MRANYLNMTPSIRRKLTRVDMSHTVRTSIRPGYICPVEIREALPGDVWSDRTYSMTRLTSSFIRPIYDDMYLDIYHFFVPLRLCFKDIAGVFNVQSDNYSFGDESLIKLPVTPTVSSDLSKESIADYLGVYAPYDAGDDFSDRTCAAGYSVLPFRANALVWNNWFRNEQVDQPVNVYDGAYNSNERINSSPWSPTNYTGMPPKANRYKDLFSSSVLRPQRGDAVGVPLEGLIFKFGAIDSTESNPSSTYGEVALDEANYLVADYDSSGSNADGFQFGEGTASIPFEDIRIAQALQRYSERSNIYGARYREYIYSAFGVNVPESEVQVPEFLSSSHTRLNVQQVAATAETEAYPVGQVAGMSQTLSSKDAYFKKTITEHGYILTYAIIRYKHTYSQGIQKLWRRIDRADFYDPTFAHLGYQPIYEYQVYAPVDGTLDEQYQNVLGYNESFVEYRVPFNRVSGEMRPVGNNLGSYYSLSDAYSEAPSLVDLIKEDGAPFDRVLAITQDTLSPFLLDLSFNTQVYRAISKYGDPS